MRKYPTDEMKEQMIREIANKVKMSLYQAALTFIAICAGYTLAQLVF